MSLLAAARAAQDRVRGLEVELAAAREERARAVALAHETEGRSYTELAEAMGLRRATVIDIVRRGRENR